MIIVAVLEIIENVTAITLEVLRSATPEQKQEIMKNYLEDMRFWRGFAENFKDK